MRPASFSVLPAEVLFFVLPHLDDLDCWSLSKVNRRLCAALHHHLAKYPSPYDNTDSRLRGSGRIPRWQLHCVADSTPPSDATEYIPDRCSRINTLTPPYILDSLCRFTWYDWKGFQLEYPAPFNFLGLFAHSIDAVNLPFFRTPDVHSLHTRYLQDLASRGVLAHASKGYCSVCVRVHDISAFSPAQQTVPVLQRVCRGADPASGIYICHHRGLANWQAVRAAVFHAIPVDERELICCVPEPPSGPRRYDLICCMRHNPPIHPTELGCEECGIAVLSYRSDWADYRLWFSERKSKSIPIFGAPGAGPLDAVDAVRHMAERTQILPCPHMQLARALEDGRTDLFENVQGLSREECRVAIWKDQASGPGTATCTFPKCGESVRFDVDLGSTPWPALWLNMSASCNLGRMDSAMEGEWLRKVLDGRCEEGLRRWGKIGSDWNALAQWGSKMLLDAVRLKERLVGKKSENEERTKSGPEMLGLERLEGIWSLDGAASVPDDGESASRLKQMIDSEPFRDEEEVMSEKLGDLFQIPAGPWRPEHDDDNNEREVNAYIFLSPHPWSSRTYSLKPPRPWNAPERRTSPVSSAVPTAAATPVPRRILDADPALRPMFKLLDACFPEARRDFRMDAAVWRVKWFVALRRSTFVPVPERFADSDLEEAVRDWGREWEGSLARAKHPLPAVPVWRVEEARARAEEKEAKFKTWEVVWGEANEAEALLALVREKGEEDEDDPYNF